MSEWRDISGRGTCFSLEGDGSVGSRRCSAYWSGIDQSWAWDVERVNKTGRTVLRYGMAFDADGAKAKAERALAALDWKAQGELFATVKETRDE